MVLYNKKDILILNMKCKLLTSLFFVFLLKLITAQGIEIHLKDSVSIIGEVQRPAKYEIKSNDNLGSVLNYALGINAFADINNISGLKASILGIISSSNFNLYVCPFIFGGRGIFRIF